MPTIGVKYNKDRCGGIIHGEDAEGLFQDSFQCLPDGRLQFKSGRLYPRAMQLALSAHCDVNCRSPRWRRSPYARGGRGFGRKSGCGCGR